MAMIKKLLFTLSVCMLVGSALYAQSTIKGTVKSPDGSPVQYLQLLLKQDDRVINGAYTDDVGAYQIYGIAAGKYDITAGGTPTCPSLFTQTGIYVSASEVKFLDLEVNCSNELVEIIVEYVPPVFSQDQTKSSNVLSGDDIRKTPGRSITSALANLEGVSTVDGAITSVRGARSDGQQMIIDGVRVRGLGGVTMQSIEGAELIQGGIPAEYGDGTSFTVITTRGVSKDYHGGVELRSSLEGYGQMTAAVSVSGPILKGKTSNDPARMGFLLTAEGNYDIDNFPARGGTWVAKQEVIDEIIADPVNYRYVSGKFSSSYNGNYLEADAFERIRVRQNAQDWGFITQGKIDIMGGGKDARGRPKNNLRFSIGGTYQYNQSLLWGTRSALFNSKHNGVNTANTLRLNARINHRVKTDTAANAILKNVMYDINVNYTLVNSKTQDRNHKDNLFAYGYLGKFSTEREDIYGYTTVQLLHPDLDSLVTVLAPCLDKYQAAQWTTFDPNGYTNNGSYYNPDLIPFTQNFINFLKGQTGVDINDASEIERNIIRRFLGTNSFSIEEYWQFFALTNGIHSVTGIGSGICDGFFPHPGISNSGFGKSRNVAIGAKASLSLNIKDHEVKFGVEFEKLTNRSFSMGSPENLWTLMRQLTWDEKQFPVDRENPYWGSGAETPEILWDSRFGYFYTTDTMMYPIISNLSNFDLNLRERRGITNNKIFLDIDSYNPNDFSLDLFSNYELLNSGNPLIGYAGFDYTGKISKNKINFDNFFSGDDLHSKDKYAIGAFEPIYMGFYLQDKFSISNLLFNVGLRLDYFNANQRVLSDPYLLRDAYTVQGLIDNGWESTLFPDNYSLDWVPYVASADNDFSTAPQSFVAYRNGHTWYNSSGQEIADPTSYLGAGGPILITAPIVGAPSKVTAKAFKKYKPQWDVMPRLSFSFPVSTNSLFYAHYDIYTYRPPNLQINPVAYLFIDNYKTQERIVNNPNLKTQKTVDYEIGFRQKVGENAALNIGAYYREFRDLVQSYRYSGAYPNTYYSYENQDFGTTQGYIVGLNMRGTKNLSFSANYTLSFAKGTGSSAGSNLSIIASGQPNLRTLTNLSYDQRHKIGANIYLSFDQGVNYNGPKTVKQKKGSDTKKEIRWLENTAASFLITLASGKPYSRAKDVYSALKWGENTKSILKGAINGANMPWEFQCNLRLDKSFALNLASKKEGAKKKPGFLNIYVDFQNIFNIKNVIDVYDYTGNASSDGFLSSQLFETQMVSMTMPLMPFQNYYGMAVANPYNFSMPFRVYLGLNFSF
jgi:outer membrane receptor for ferrienterochelin and colicin